MRIVLATPIYPPEVGGPAFYAESLAHALREEGHTVRVTTYGRLKRLPPGFRHIAYLGRLFIASLSSESLIAFDTYSVGVPALIVSKLMGKKLLVRIGGDFVWEHYVNRTGFLTPLPEFYQKSRILSFKEGIVFSINKWVARRARLVFSTRWLVPFVEKSYGIDGAKVSVIENAIPEKVEPIPPIEKNFLFYTRQIPLKNHELFREAFARAKKEHPEIILEEGMVSRAELMERMRSCYAVVLPSVSEVTPNYIIDALRCGKPFLLTKHSGYAERFAQYGVTVDPSSVEDMAAGIVRLAENDEYERLRANVVGFSEVRPYADVAKEFVALLT